jgi:hypothetical protein
MNLYESAIAYRVFRNIYLDEESYSVQLELQHDLDEEASEQVILKASEEHLLDLVEGSDPQEYTVDFSELADRWYDLWEEQIGEAPIAPENFESFLISYMKSYMKHEKHSTLREMLVDEFRIGLSNQRGKGRLSRDLEELEDHLNEQYDSKRSPGEHVQYGLNHR